SPIGATTTVLSEKIEVVVIDVLMPTMNGDKLAKLMRGHPQLQRLGVVLVSASEGRAMRALAADIPAAFIGKSQVRTKLAQVVAMFGERPKEGEVDAKPGAGPKSPKLPRP